MYTEIKFKENCENSHIIMNSKIQREDPDLKRLLKLYIENKIDDRIRERVGIILKENELIDKSNSITNEGTTLLNSGRVHICEYGQYQITSFRNDFTEDVKQYTTLKRERHSTDQGSKKGSGDIIGDIYDRDQKTTVHVIGKINQKYNDDPIVADMEVKITDEGTVSCELTTNLNDGKPTHVSFDSKINYKSIYENCIKDYSAEKDGVVINDISSLSNENLMYVTRDYSKSDIGKTINNSIFDRPIQDIHAHEIKLRAADKHVAGEWMCKLRELWWNEEFVPVERANADQEYWSNKLLGETDRSLIKSDVDLFEELEGKSAFWGVSAMADLVPTSQNRVPLFISPDTNYNDEISKKIFSKEVMKEAKKIIVVDPYPGLDSEKVLRKWMDDEEIQIVFYANDARYHSSPGRKLEQKDLTDNAELRFDERNKSVSHQRYIIIVKKNNDVNVWNMDNSLNQFHLDDGIITTSTVMKFTPEPYLYDESLKKLVGGSN